ncbi:MAG: multiheme c-type cytochrome [Armatimonadota bacterium]
MRSCLVCLPMALASVSVLLAQEEAPLSDQTQACLLCHQQYNPGIVEDWRASRHAQVTPEAAIAKPQLERRVSSQDIPDGLRSVAVGCYECHGLNAAQHEDNFDHLGFNINVIVSPNDCQTCHADEVEQYSGSKKAHALANLRQNPVYHTLVETITSLKQARQADLIQSEASDYTKGDTCYACHGTEVTVAGMKTIASDLGEVEVPDLVNWPNQGVGRVNPDGSRGSCTACHPRHSFSIEIARQPYTCGQCHLEPDVPAYNVYRESKHGNIVDSHKAAFNWEAVPWKVGTDFRAPTCATCHNALIADPAGEQIVARSHDFGARLWVRLFGLVYAHPQPKSGQTHLIRNADGLPLPTTFTGTPASDYLIGEAEQSRRRGDMVKVCQSCHSASWAQGHFAKLDNTIAETNQMTLAATQLVLRAWNRKLADRANPFDEAIEQRWIKQWLFYANSVRYASAMGGPDYAAFKNGWWQLTNNLQEMREFHKLRGRGRR